MTDEEAAEAMKLMSQSTPEEMREQKNRTVAHLIEIAVAIDRLKGDEKACHPLLAALLAHVYELAATEIAISVKENSVERGMERGVVGCVNLFLGLVEQMTGIVTSRKEVSA